MQSCTTKDDESINSGITSELVNKNDLYIERAPTSISTVDANKMAALFKGVTPTTRAATANEGTTTDSWS